MQLHTYVPTELHRYGHTQLHGYMQILPKEKGHIKRCLPIRKHRGAREKRYSFGYAVFLILALMK